MRKNESKIWKHETSVKRRGVGHGGNLSKGVLAYMLMPTARSNSFRLWLGILGHTLPLDEAIALSNRCRHELPFLPVSDNADAHEIVAPMILRSAWLPEKDRDLIAVVAEQIALSLVDNMGAKVLAHDTVPWFTWSELEQG